MPLATVVALGLRVEGSCPAIGERSDGWLFQCGGMIRTDAESITGGISMMDVFVRMATTPALAGVVAESVRWTAGADPAAPRHQVVTLYGDPTVTHLAWALAAANRGQPDALWRIAEDGSAAAAELSLATAVLHDDATALLSSNGPQLRTAIAHLLSVRGKHDHASIRVPIVFDGGGDMDGDAMLALLRAAEGDMDAESMEDELAA